VDGDDAEGVLAEVIDEPPRGGGGVLRPGRRGFLAGLGVPADERHAPYVWDGWTAGLVRQGVAQMARKFQTNPEELLAKALQGGTVRGPMVTKV
jgi:hypothetical protein